MNMRLGWSLVAIQAALILILGWVLIGTRIPLGIPDEWLWPRPQSHATAGWLAVAAVVLGLQVAFFAIGYRSLRHRRGWAIQVFWLVCLALITPIAQIALQSCAPNGYGLVKWGALALSDSSGYLDVARDQMDDPWIFWREYPGWVQHQDSLHLGTHPPGLFLVSHAARWVMQRDPELARHIDRILPDTIEITIRAMVGPWSPQDRAALALVSLVTVLFCAWTAVPLYVLARTEHEPAQAWGVAACWTLVPAALLFQPVADTAYPLPAILAIALAAWSARCRGGRVRVIWALLAGGVLALGMQLTLAFLAVGLVAALVVLVRRDIPWLARLVTIAAIATGFVAVTAGFWAISGANPLEIWWHNQAKHAEFYQQYTRTYWKWLLFNPLELAIGLGIPAAVWAIVGLADARRPPLAAWWTLLVLALLTLGGRNLSEVARLWLPLMPPLLLATGQGVASCRTPGVLWITCWLLMGLQCLVMQSGLQVVFPL